MQPKKIAIACQVPQIESYTKEAEFLFQSINEYGGKLAKAEKIACCREPLSDETTSSLEKLGVKTRLIEPFDSRCVYANKIPMLGFSEEVDFDILVALDTDIIIRRDFSNLIDEEKIGVVRDDIDPLGLDNWKILFKHFDLKLPEERFHTYKNWKETIPYFNTGVLVFPQSYISEFYEAWKYYTIKLLDTYEKFPTIRHYYPFGVGAFYIEQLSFALAIHGGRFPYFTLPIEMNFPTHIKLHPNCKTEHLDPFLIHHHHRISKLGNIRNCYYENINKCFDKIKFSADRKNDSEIIIDDLYMKTLRRPADTEGLNHFSALIESKKQSLEDIQKMFFDSDEYKSLKNSDKICLGYENIEKNDLSFFPFFNELDLEPLVKIINFSKKYFGWFSRHTSRLFEYPWLTRQIADVHGKRILDIGTGVSSLPIFLANEGATIVTVDNHQTIRELNDDKDAWNEWGYIDYSKINKNIISYNSSIESVNLPKEDFDYIYSASVIEHLPKSIRKTLWKKINYWLKPNGVLLLTIDLIKNSEQLYNVDEYYAVDFVHLLRQDGHLEYHGTLDDMKKEFIQNGLKLESCAFNKKPINNSNTYLAFLKLTKL